jgi:predicted negative regulator of RcsB-dependent stress response
MAQATRTNAGTTGMSDDPVENVSEWFQLNSKPILIGLAVAVVLGAGIIGYRYMSAAKVTEASAALYSAQGPMLEGKLPEAQTALTRVSTRYSGTAAGEQATLLLAQVLYDLKQYQNGVTTLEKAVGGVSRENRASFRTMIATGYEAMGKLEEAAKSYGQAAEDAPFKAEKGQYRASQARSLMLAGKLDDAKKIWQELSVEDNTAYGQEARIRLGEIAGAAAK